MAGLLLCEAEKTFVLHGVQENYRSDGRQRSDYRPIELETDFVSHTMGSARLRLANTDVVVAIKTEIDTPFPDQPEEGKIEFFVDCSANATPEFEGRGGESLATEISNSLSTAYKSSKAFNLASLCVIPSRMCWKIYVDILILECGGNLFDAVSLAVKAALYNTRIPAVKAAILDGGDIDLDLSDDPYECRRLDVTNVPIMVTLCKIGEHSVVDPTTHEEQCSASSLVVAVSGNKFSSILKQGFGSFHPNTLKESISLGRDIGGSLDQALKEALSREEGITKSEPIGFLN